MEKISKEELMKKLNLSEEDLMKVAGGEGNDECRQGCTNAFLRCQKSCAGFSDPDMCMNACTEGLIRCRERC